ncbi:hypothetical protein GCM10023085_44620 [Actinomadura viridis]
MLYGTTREDQALPASGDAEAVVAPTCRYGRTIGADPCAPSGRRHRSGASATPINAEGRPHRTAAGQWLEAALSKYPPDGGRMHTTAYAIFPENVVVLDGYKRPILGAVDGSHCP